MSLIEIKIKRSCCASFHSNLDIKESPSSPSPDTIRRGGRLDQGRGDREERSAGWGWEGLHGLGLQRRIGYVSALSQ